MNVSDAGRKFIEKEEGVRLKAYQDSVGVWTIGVGHTTAAGAPVVTKGLKITVDEADEIFRRDLTKFEGYVNAAIRVPVTQNQFDAMVSLCYNIGPGAFRGSSVARKLNAGDVAGAAEAFLMWKNADGKPILLARRKREKALFLTEAPTVAKQVSKAASKAVKATKAQPALTLASGTAVVATGSTVLTSVQSWEGVAALVIILLAAAVGFYLWKRSQS